MDTKIRTTSNALACTLHYDQKLRFVSPLPCKYDTEAIGYAAARFIRHCPAVRDELIRQAVAAGLSVGQRVKPARIRIHTSAKSLSLPGDSAYVNVIVKPGTLEIKSVRIENDAGRPGKKQLVAA